MGTPLLDVSDVLDDPLFADTTLTFTRNVQTVGAGGRAVNTPTTAALSAVVTSDAGDILERFGDGAYVRDSISVTTRTRLTNGDTTHAADVVTYKGERFTVYAVNDYSSWGAGYVSAVCHPIPLAGAP